MEFPWNFLWILYVKDDMFLSHKNIVFPGFSYSFLMCFVVARALYGTKGNWKSLIIVNGLFDAKAYEDSQPILKWVNTLLTFMRNLNNPFKGVRNV